MKKLGLLVMPLMAVSFLASCNNGGGGNTPEQAEFMLSSDRETVVEGKSAIVYVDWKPTNTIKFESFTFTANPEKDNEISFDQTDNPRPMPVTITFEEEITESINGTLSFAYEDITTQTKCENSIDITISKPEPVESWTVILDQASHQYGSFENEQFSITIKDYIGESKATIGFVPETQYNTTRFTVTTLDDNLLVAYKRGSQASITITKKEGTFEDKDEVTLHFEESTAPWYQDINYLNTLTKDDVNKEGGEVQTLKVNGLDHKVHLIGIDEDKDASGNDIHTTWEFLNIISDSTGHYLATQWNDTNDTDKATYNYKTSTIRNALNGNSVSNVHWAQKEETAWSDDYNCSVLDMLKAGNDGLDSVLKTPKKYVRVYNDKKSPEPGWEDQDINDKLFLLTPRELGYDDYEEDQESREHTSPYTYYAECTEGYDEPKRVKRQVNETDMFEDTDIEISYDPSSSQLYEDAVTNYAGSNNEYGGSSWLRSPCDEWRAWDVYDNGLINWCTVYSAADGVAPAFCI